MHPAPPYASSKIVSTGGAPSGKTRSKRDANGLTGLAQVMEINAPLSLIILFLGSNDFQFSIRTTTPGQRRKASQPW